MSELPSVFWVGGNQDKVALPIATALTVTLNAANEVLALPLIDIGPLADVTPVLAARTHLPDVQAAMFVSANAVRHFMAVGAGTAWPAGTQAWATGPGLSKYAARLDGVPTTSQDRWLPGAEAMLALALARLNAGEKDDVMSLGPLYARPSSAEQQWASLGR